MKTFFIASLFILNVSGNPVQTIVRIVEDLKQCAEATDLVCPRDDITFWLFTKSTQVNPIKLDVNSLDKAPWVDAPLKFIVHGFSVDRDTAVNAVLRPAYFATGDFNIISVDWSALGRDGCYLQTIENVPTVAKCVAKFFNAVTKAHQFPDVHLLGHSMGAHVAAWASDEIPHLPRLTKFDVANPLMDDKNSKNGTADFIDVYHSNGGLKGQKVASGDVDVYFNNGVFQPGCKCDTGCSHLRAVQYYADSIGGTMKAFPCGSFEAYQSGVCRVPKAEDLVVVGENADKKLKGLFLVFTKSQPPFLLEDRAYTDEASFRGFNKALEGECAIVSQTKKLLSDWLP